MAILRNKTQGDFTIIQNMILRDRRVSLKGRGLFTTLCSLPDNWSFSEEGLAKTLRDGKDSVHSALEELEMLGYVKRYKRKDNKGRFESVVEVFPEANAPEDDNSAGLNNKVVNETNLDGKEDNPECGLSVTEKPSREIRDGETVAEKQPQYNTLNTINKSKKDNKECVSVMYTLENQILTKEEYDELVRQYGKETIDYQISRILSRPYRGCLRKDIIAKWSKESIDNSSRIVSDNCNSVSSKNSFSDGFKQQYDFAALNKFIQNS